MSINQSLIRCIASESRDLPSQTKSILADGESSCRRGVSRKTFEISTKNRNAAEMECSINTCSMSSPPLGFLEEYSFNLLWKSMEMGKLGKVEKFFLWNLSQQQIVKIPNTKPQFTRQRVPDISIHGCHVRFPLPASISFIADWKISLLSRISFYIFGSEKLNNFDGRTSFGVSCARLFIICKQSSYQHFNAFMCLLSHFVDDTTVCSLICFFFLSGRVLHQQIYSKKSDSHPIRAPGTTGVLIQTFVTRVLTNAI